MGQQRFLILVVAFCVFGILMSARLIAVQSDVQTDPRAAIWKELRALAAKADAYKARARSEEAGGGSYASLTASPTGIFLLTTTPATPFGEFSVVGGDDDETIRLLAIGRAPGYDPRKPIKMMIDVSSDEHSIYVFN